MTFIQDADGVWRPDAATFKTIQMGLPKAPPEARFDTVEQVRSLLDAVENEMPKGAARRLYDDGWRIGGAQDHLAEIERVLNIVMHNAAFDTEGEVNVSAAIALAAAGIYK